MNQHSDNQSTSQEHRRRVAAIAKQLRNQPKRQPRLVKIYHGSTNSTRQPDYTNKRLVDTSSLRHIIEINRDEAYALVEPSVQLDELVAATLAEGLVPPVVMEFPGISVGGGIQGGAAESSSFKYGGFHETALEYEMVLGDGEIVYASRDSKPDLFWGTACSYGSLGIITLVKLRLIPAQPYVRLVYRRTDSYRAALDTLDQCMQESELDFVDGILFAPDRGVIMTGYLAGQAEGPITRFSGRRDPWFYRHAERLARRYDSYEEYIPLQDYLFRYDRGAFWMGRLAFRVAHVPFNRLTRWLLDAEMHTRRLYKWVHSTNLTQRIFIQDIFMPPAHTEAFLHYSADRLAIWPLWLLPMHTNHEKLDYFGLSFTKADYVIDIGVWGETRARDFAAFAALNREVEQHLVGWQARKTLYAHAYYSREEFWRLYDRGRYQVLRRKYHAEAVFEDIYDKVTVTEAYGGVVWRILLKRLYGKLSGH